MNTSGKKNATIDMVAGAALLLLGSTMCLCALFEGFTIPFAPFPKMALSEHTLIWMHGFMTGFIGLIMLIMEVFYALDLVEQDAHSVTATFFSFMLVLVADVSSLSIGTLNAFWGSGRGVLAVSAINEPELERGSEMHRMCIYFTLIAECLLVIPWFIMVFRCSRFLGAVIRSHNPPAVSKEEKKD